MRLHPDDISAIAAEVARRMTAEDKAEIRRIIREELAAARHAENVYHDQAHLVATTTPQERNRMFHANRKAAKGTR